MTHQSSIPDSLLDEVQSLTLACLSGEAPPEQAARLDSLVCADDDARSVYLRVVLDSMALRDWSGSSTVRPAPEPAPTPEMPQADPSGFFPALWNSLPSVLDGRTPRATFWMLFIPVAAVFFGSFGWLVWSSMPGPRVAEEEKIRLDVETWSAELTYADRAIWAGGLETYPKQGRVYYPGDQLDLQSGLAEITFNDGAQIVLEGPCQVTLQGTSAARLQRGKLAAKVEKDTAQGFVIDTPFGTVTDLGTEFGVEVTEETIDVGVYRGKVSMAVAASGEVVHLTAGETARADRQGNVTSGSGQPERLAIVREIRRPAPPATPARPPHSANGAIIVTTLKSGSPPTVSSSDLAQTQYLSSSGTGGDDASSKHADLFSGVIGNTNGSAADPGEVRLDNTNTITVNFDISTNTLGYDITRIDSYFGWNPEGGGRSNQGYEIILTFVDDTTASLAGPQHWEPNSPASYWTTVSFTASGGGTLNSNTVNLNGGGAVAGTSVLASGVKAITFDMTEDANAGGFVVAREFDIFGAPTAIPEPDSQEPSESNEEPGGDSGRGDSGQTEGRSVHSVGKSVRPVRPDDTSNHGPGGNASGLGEAPVRGAGLPDLSGALVPRQALNCGCAAGVLPVQCVEAKRPTTLARCQWHPSATPAQQTTT